MSAYNDNYKQDNHDVIDIGKLLSDTLVTLQSVGDNVPPVSIVSTIMSNWAEIWGRELCQDVKFVNIIGTELSVLVNNHVIAVYVKKASKSVIDKVNTLLSDKKIEYINVVVSGESK
ncbi:MAG: DciA family protein [Actinobacteria bacterium]|nr:DciA family protein [Actinomycetota bacterium]